MLHDFQLAGRRVRLWQRPGESYEHVLMKALGFAMYAGEYPELEIEAKVGLRYRPDLVARRTGELPGGDFLFWGEAGENAVRKTAWLLKHARVEELVLFKIAINAAQLVRQMRAEIPAKYRPEGKLVLINFREEIVRLTADKQIEKVSADWFSEIRI
jgi:hypothetical protein